MTLLNLALATAPNVDGVDPYVEQVARILAPLTEVRSLSMNGLGAGCPDETGDAWGLAIEQEHNPGLICMMQSAVAPSCSSLVRLTRNRSGATLCSPRNGGLSVPQAPDWVTRLAPLLLDENEPIFIRPIQGGSALLLTHSIRHFLMVRAPTGWLLLPREIGESDPDDKRDQVRIMETSRLTSTPSWGIIASFYSGGSESGELDTELYIVVPERSSLRLLVQRTIGVFRWAATAEERAHGPLAAASDMNARPHVAVILKPELTPDGLLRLRLVEKSLGQMSSFCTRSQMVRNQAIDSELCPLQLINQIRDDAGTWQLSGDKWTRVPAAAPRRLLPRH